jgi:hypothetical protein
MRPNKNFGNEDKNAPKSVRQVDAPAKSPAKGTPKEPKKGKPATITPNAADIQEQTDNGTGNFYHVPHAGPFLYATDRREDGFMFNRKGH